MSVLLWMRRIYDRNKFSVTFNRTQHSPKNYTHTNIQKYTHKKSVPHLSSRATVCMQVKTSREWIEVRGIEERKNIKQVANGQWIHFDCFVLYIRLCVRLLCAFSTRKSHATHHILRRERWTRERRTIQWLSDKIEKHISFCLRYNDFIRAEIMNKALNHWIGWRLNRVRWFRMRGTSENREEEKKRTENK